MTGDGSRPRRSVAVDGVPWTLYDAGRTPSGLGLGYFVCDDAEAEDRRAALPADIDLASLDEGALHALWVAGRGLTSTERRIVDGDGAIWLAQSVGPVWARREGAAGTVGIRLRCISADRPVAEIHGATLAGMSDAELISRVVPPEGVPPSSD